MLEILILIQDQETHGMISVVIAMMLQYKGMQVLTAPISFSTQGPMVFLIEVLGIAFLQAIRAMLIKGDIAGGPPKDYGFELQQLLSESLVSDGITDVFKVAGLKNPDISIMSDEFLSEVSKIPQKNLAVELLQKLLNDEIL